MIENLTGETHRPGRIEVVCGSMFSGKTEELIRRQIFSLIAEKTGVSAFELELVPSFTQNGMLDGAHLICKCESPAVYTVLDIKRAQLETYLERLLICEVKIEVE